MTLPPFQRFIDLHRTEVLRFLVAAVGRHDADDCFQETFISALRAYPRLRPDSNLRAWVLTIAHRKALDTHRARARRPAPVEDVAMVGAASVAGGDAPVAGASLVSAAPPGEEETELWSAVARLPERQRHAVALRFVCDMDYAEVASVMASSPEAARRNVHEGLRKLREVLQ